MYIISKLCLNIFINLTRHHFIPWHIIIHYNCYKLNKTKIQSWIWSILKVKHSFLEPQLWMNPIRWRTNTSLYPTWYIIHHPLPHCFFVLANLWIIWTLHYKSPKWIFFTHFPIFHQSCWHYFITSRCKFFKVYQNLVTMSPFFVFFYLDPFYHVKTHLWMIMMESVIVIV